jgi:hypothetical protein
MGNANPQQHTSRDQIAELAYQIWEQRGRPHGCDVEFWLEAERQILLNSKPSRQPLAVSVRTPEAVAARSQPSRASQPPPERSDEEPTGTKARTGCWPGAVLPKKPPGQKEKELWAH